MNKKFINILIVFTLSLIMISLFVTVKAGWKGDFLDTPNSTKYRTGDINGDGKVSVVDYKKVLLLIVSPEKFNEKQIQAADVNGDGKVSIVDAKCILKKVAGMYYADINKDKKITTVDARAILKYINGQQEFDGVQFFAADIDNDGMITETDARLLLQHLIK